MKEQPDERYRKTALKKVGEKIKQQVEDWVVSTPYNVLYKMIF